MNLRKNTKQDTLEWVLYSKIHSDLYLNVNLWGRCSFLLLWWRLDFWGTLLGLLCRFLFFLLRFCSRLCCISCLFFRLFARLRLFLILGLFITFCYCFLKFFNKNITLLYKTSLSNAILNNTTLVNSLKLTSTLNNTYTTCTYSSHVLPLPQ